MTPAELADEGDRLRDLSGWTKWRLWTWENWPEIATALREADTNRAEALRVHLVNEEMGEALTEARAELAALRVLVEREHAVRVWLERRSQRGEGSWFDLDAAYAALAAQAPPAADEGER